MVVPPLSAWPLSGAATAVLRDPRTRPEQVLRLALRELLVRQALVAEVLPAARPRAVPRLQVAPGSGAPGPVPLVALHAALVRELDRAALLPAVLGSALRADRDLPVRLRDACRSELRLRDLLTGEHRRLLGLVPQVRWRRTAEGDAWAAAVEGAVHGDGEVDPAVLLALDGVATAGYRHRRRARRAARGERQPETEDLLDAVLDGDLRSGTDGPSSSGSSWSSGGDGWSGGDGGGGDGGGGGGGD